MKAIGWLFALLGLLALPAHARDAVEDRKIDYLIGAVEQMHDATFIRNGGEYNAQQAADHMRLKLKYAGNRVRTAQDFILCCATGSSITGTPYQIKFADGHTVPSADFLRQRLAEFPAPPTPAPDSGQSR
jgi:Family of unknown function (DUF5329)